MRAQPVPSAPTPDAPPEAVARTVEARFYELDILRGLAACLVVIFHYKHFLLNDYGNFDYSQFPFAVVLGPVYVHGQHFVELFFSISGYVFFWLYGDAIAGRRLGAKSFFVARFARLYPLYIVTLIAAAVLQWGYQSLYGAPFIYPHNTLFNFGLSVVGVQQWLPGSLQTFNGPAWSISVELFLYLAFFAVAFFRLNRPWILAVIVAAGLIARYMQVPPASDFSRGIPSFFLGGLAFYAVRWLESEGREGLRGKVDSVLKWLVPVLWLLTYVRAQPLLWEPVKAGLHLPAPVRFLDTLTVEGLVYGLVPLTLVVLGLRRENWRHPLLSLERLRALSWIGDISYSVYLIHFPLQLAIMLGLRHWAWPDRVALFSSPLMLMAFIAVAVGLARFSFVYFEMPMRARVRRWLSPQKET